MAENEKRHVCACCGRKMIERRMIMVGYCITLKPVWLCDHSNDYLGKLRCYSAENIIKLQTSGRIKYCPGKRPIIGIKVNNAIVV